MREAQRARLAVKGERACKAVKGARSSGKPKLTEHQSREAIKGCDVDEESLSSIARSYYVSSATFSRLGK